MNFAGLPRWRTRYSRLRSMDRYEFMYRMRAAMREQSERLRFNLAGPTSRGPDIPWASGQDRAYLNHYLRETCSPRFYLPNSSVDRQTLRHLYEEQFPAWKERAVCEAQRLCEHRVALLGYEDVSLGREIRWNRDPITGAVWPSRFWADYDLTSQGQPADPKNIHELGRTQHLPRLGKAYFLTGEDRYANEAVEQMLSWISQNPPGCGIHWHSSLEISLRITSWLWTLFFIADAPCLSETSLRAIFRSTAAQLDHVFRFLSEYSSPNTHLLGEAAALYLGGTIFREWEPAGRWRDTGRFILIQESERQFTPDGFHGELSTYYHCYALDFYLQATVLSVANDDRLPSGFWQRLESALDVMMHLSRSNGSLPQLGDADGGRALALQQVNYRSFSDSLCTGAVLFGRPQFKYVARQFQEETLWFLGAKSWWIFATMPSMEPRELHASFQHSGLAIQRSGWDRKSSCLVFDFGGMGMFRGGHGHADALAVVLSIGDQEVLTDPGTGVYNLAPQWRNYFRSTRAHNTAVVDGVGQSEPGETFSWNSVAQTRVCRNIHLQNLDFVEAEHDGFLRLKDGIRHRRAVLHCRPDYWIILDRFLGSGIHNFELFYHLPEHARTTPGYDGVTAAPLSLGCITASVGDASLEMFCLSEAELTTEITSGTLDEIQGWISPLYGQRRPSPVLRLATRGTAPQTILTVLIPSLVNEQKDVDTSDAAIRVKDLVPDNGKCLALELCRETGSDFLIIPSSEDSVEVRGYKMSGELFWMRRLKNGEEQLFALNASHFADENLDSRSRTLINTFQPSIHIHWNQEGRVLERFEDEGVSCAESVES